MSLYVYVIIILIAFTAGGSSAWKVQEWRYDAKEKEALELAQENAKFNRQAASKSATTFEVKRANNEEHVQIIVTEVEKIVERPVYINMCIDDDGLRIINAEVNRTSRNTSQPSQPLPKASEPKWKNWFGLN